ncbi:Ras guanine nucleotide exchange factor bud5 [Elasticomyces elasticus]|nr:Ras guanine nucleotide exchange factor bud5 [Elasticomyces elasticus]
MPRHQFDLPSAIRLDTTGLAAKGGYTSPPLTPISPQELSGAQPSLQAEPLFHNYLRAFHSFHPTSTASSTLTDESITVPINRGDVILVHSIHANGWADGTLLTSGARGWLPTNYCEAYDNIYIRNLLNATTQLWDLLRSEEDGDLSVFVRQDYIRGLIAGVRYLLDQSRCLHREAPLVQSHVGIRRLRKSLLNDLSCLVKLGKRLQETLGEVYAEEVIGVLLDEIVLKAFKVVTRAVRFLDVWAQDNAANNNTVPKRSTQIAAPPTSLTNSTSLTVIIDSPRGSRSSDREFARAAREFSVVSQGCLFRDAAEQTNTGSTPSQTASPFDNARSIWPDTSRLIQSGSNPDLRTRKGKRTSVLHRVSNVRTPGRDHTCNLASEHLHRAHDILLGCFGSFIGSHLISRQPSELLTATEQSAKACQDLLNVIEKVWEHDQGRSAQLEQARKAMQMRLTELVKATRGLFSVSTDAEGAPLVLPSHEKELVIAAATGCVRSAGDCVATARLVIEQIGDFEFEEAGQGIGATIFEELQMRDLQERSSDPDSNQVALMPELIVAPLVVSPHRRPSVTVSPPPQPDLRADRHTCDGSTLEAPVVTAVTSLTDTRMDKIQMTSQDLAKLTWFRLPTLTEIQDDAPCSPDSMSKQSTSSPARKFSVGISMTDSSSTYPGSIRDSEHSLLSRTSTRATTPDLVPAHYVSNSTDPALLTSFGSVSSTRSIVTDDSTDDEVHIMEKTYAHELIFNKEGQITGGSLPALVERLTLHDSVPDPMFVTTFYLTFRLFATPSGLAKCLVDRFDYVGENKSTCTSVRLRVYNVFKRWVEAYWQPDADGEALEFIQEFAAGKLQARLPAAGRKLAELAGRMLYYRPGASWLVSNAHQIGVSSRLENDRFAPIPNSVITKSQLNTLRSSRIGSSTCSILDFDPLELARQFTLIESRIFCAIRPEELLATTKKSGSKAANVKAMSKLSTDLAHLVAETILSLEDAKKRAAIIKQWTKIAMSCLELNNYDSLMAIVCSVNQSTILRLKRTWDLVSARTKTRLEELKSIVDHSHNYAVLRKRLDSHVAPCLPFVGMYLTDLTFVDAGNQPTRQLQCAAAPADEQQQQPLTVINFDKHTRTARIIGQLQRFQVPYRLHAVPELQEWIERQIHRVGANDLDCVQKLYCRSLLLEPREVPAAAVHEGAAAAAAAVVMPASRLQTSGEQRAEVAVAAAAREKFDLFAGFGFAALAALKERPTGSV